MAKPRIPNQKKQYQLLNRRLAAYMAAVRRIYGELNSEAARIALSTGYDGKQPFAWKDYPATKARVRKLQERFVSQLGGLIMTGTSDEWKRSNLQQDLIVDKVLKAYHTSREDAANERYYRDNSEALQAFQQRKEHGMNLSDKLWDQSQAYREELQDTISAAIERGTDAITLSKQISKYLSDFPAMQRDYKEKYGKASKVQNCEYRSIRLARSEINMAYRSAEQQRWRQLDFVVGYEIKMSGSHPVHDVCDELAGKYPKDFVWNGWHPNCMCYEIPILKTEDEFYSDEDKPSVNEITDVPQNFKDWSTDNWQRIEVAMDHGTLPYFISDNSKYVRENLTIERVAELRHERRDDEMILRMSANRTIMRNTEVYKGVSYYQRYLDTIKECRYYGIDSSVLENYIRTKEVDIDELKDKISELGDKIFEAHHARWEYKQRWGTVLSDLRRGTYEFAMMDLQEAIERFELEHPLAGGASTIPYGAKVPNVSLYRKFANEVEREVAKRRKDIVERNQALIENNLSIERGKPMAHKEADTGRTNPNFDMESYEWSHNCQCCVVTYEMRRRGYDVTAAPRTDNRYIEALAYHSGYAYIDPITGRMPSPLRMYYHTDETIESYAKRLLENYIPDKGRYAVSFAHNEHVGHIFSIERRSNGTILVYDPQTDRYDIYTPNDISKFTLLLEYLGGCDKSFPVEVLRVDDKLINPRYISNFVNKVES